MAKTSEMTLFSIVEEGQCIISERGIYKQTAVFERRDREGKRRLYAETRGGFIKLLGRGNTTAPAIKWDAIEGISFVEDFMGPESAMPLAGALKAAE